MPHYRSRGPRRQNYYNVWTIPRGWGPIYYPSSVIHHDNPYYYYRPRRPMPRPTRQYWVW